MLLKKIFKKYPNTSKVVTFVGITSGILTILDSSLNISSKFSKQVGDIKVHSSDTQDVSTTPVEKDKVPITFCAFYEVNIAKDRKPLQGTIQLGSNMPIALNITKGDYVHLTEAVEVYGAGWGATGFNFDTAPNIELFSEGQRVLIQKFGKNKVEGYVGEELVFSFRLDERTGKYYYSQFKNLDQTGRSKDGYVIYLSFGYHAHRQDKELIQSKIMIDVYDKQHRANDVIVNGVRE